LEGISFLIVYTTFMKFFMIIGREDFELLRKALLDQLEKVLNILEGFIIPA
jgi:hypothetical protein